MCFTRRLPESRTPTYIRHGASSLLAALEVATGSVLGKTCRGHRTAEFVCILHEIEARVPDGFDVHVVMDNSPTKQTDPLEG